MTPDGETATCYNTALRERLVPMAAAVMAQVHWVELQLVAWDVVIVANPQLNAMICGVAIAVRGIDIAGPMKELVRFEPFDSWNPDQNRVNRAVFTCVEGLRQFRAQQARTGGNGR